MRIRTALFSHTQKSLDARNKSDVKYVFSVEVSKEPFASKKTVVIDAKKIPTLPIVVVGSGPAGLFAQSSFANTDLNR